MRERLTKAQVEALFEAMDSPFRELVDALAIAIGHLHGSIDLDTVLRSIGRGADADRLAMRDEETAWNLAAELNENRRL